MRRLYVLAALIPSLTLLIACGGAPMTTASLATPAANTTTPTSTPTSTPNTGSGSTSTSSTSGPTGTSGSGTTSSSLLPVPPSSATVFDSIQNTTNAWSDCSACAGGDSVTSNYSSTPFLATPSLSGSSRQFFLGGPAWASALWIHKLGAQNAATHFLWDFYVYFDAPSAAAVWSAEYDLWQSIGGRQHMMGTQCVFGTNEWDVWDSANNRWVNTGVACPRFTGNAWHHIQWDVQRISATQYQFNTVFVDDQPFPINRVFDAVASNWSDDLGVQWQLDQNGAGTALNEWIDRVKLTVW